jgi:hypothetical protein
VNAVPFVQALVANKIHATWEVAVSGRHVSPASTRSNVAPGMLKTLNRAISGIRPTPPLRDRSRLLSPKVLTIPPLRAGEVEDGYRRLSS